MTMFRMRRVSIFRAVAVGLLLVGTAGAGSARADDDEIIARIGTTGVNAEDIRAYLATLDPQSQAAIAANPALLSQTVRMFLAQQQVLKDALAQKWDQQPAVAAQLERVRQSAVTELYLQSVSKPADDFPSDAEIQSAYDANKTAFLVPRQFRLAQIFVAVSKDADKASDDKAHRKLDDAQKKLKQKGADFGAIAEAMSDDQDGTRRGGEIGWLLETQIRPEIRTVALGLTKDGASDPLRLDDGWHIIKLLDTKAAYTRPLGEVKDRIAQQLRADRALANRKAYLAKVLEQTPPAINEIALGKVLGKSAAALAAH
jgi:parvulin-like peptidyl-prolyl isomerase